MKVAVIGRTRILLEAAKKIVANGFSIPLIYTCKAEEFYRCTEEDFREFSRSIGADFFCDLAINTPERVDLINKYECDVAISVNWLNILKAPICNAFKHGIWNAHGGDLPRYRGNACQNWAILNNESHIGLSIYEMEPGVLDSGDIILKEYYDLHPTTYISDVYNWMGERIPNMFLEALQKLEKGTLKKKKQSQNEHHILRCYPRKPQDSRIVWNQRAVDILRLIRASSQPFSGAFCYLEDNTLIRIWKAEEIEHPGQFLAIPGQVLYGKNGDPIIACGKGVLQLTEVTLDNNEDAKPLILKSLRNRLI